MTIASKYAVLCASITLACAASAQALPDLVVSAIDSPNLDGGVIKVQVKNQGAGPSASSSLALRVWPLDEKVKYKVFSPKIPALQAGQQVELSVKTGFLLSQVKYEAIADRSNTVKESDEKNNRLEGQFGGKP